MAVDVCTDAAEPFSSRTSWPARTEVGASIPGTIGLGGMACPMDVQERSEFLAVDSDQVDPQENSIKTVRPMTQVQLSIPLVGVW